MTGFGDLNLKFSIDFGYFNIYEQFRFHALSPNYYQPFVRLAVSRFSH